MRQRLLMSLVPGVLAAALTAGCGGDAPPAASAPSTAVTSSAASVTPSPSTAPFGSTAPPARTTPSTAPTAAGSSNGLESLPAEEVLRRARQAVGEATSVHVLGSATEGGVKTDVDVRMEQDQGTGTLRTPAGGLEIVRKGKTVYVRGDVAFYQSVVGDANTAKLLEGKWLKSPANARDYRQVASLLDFDVFTREALKPEGKVGKADTREIDGVPALGLRDEADNNLVYISLEGEPLPLAVTPGPGEQAEGELRFTDWNAPVQVTVPPAAATIDVEELNRSR